MGGAHEDILITKWCGFSLMGVPLIALVWALPASHETMPLGNTACELENKINEMNKYSMLCTYKQN